MRWVVQDKFAELLSSQGLRPSSVVVVGGTFDEPELDVLRRSDGPEVFFCGLDHYDSNRTFFLDLNESRTIDAGPFDLVLCSQVLEHVRDVPRALDNLTKLVNPDGHLWIGFPYSNFPHGSPSYYAAGYAPLMIEELLQDRGFETVASGIVGSPRIHLYTHFFRRWPSECEHQHPLMSVDLANTGLIGGILRFVKYLPQRILATLFSSQPLSDERFATEGYVLARKESN